MIQYGLTYRKEQSAVDAKNLKMEILKKIQSEKKFEKTGNLVLLNLPELSEDNVRSHTPKKSGAQARNNTIIRGLTSQKILVTFIPKVEELKIETSLKMVLKDGTGLEERKEVLAKSFERKKNLENRYLVIDPKSISDYDETDYLPLFEVYVDGQNGLLHLRRKKKIL